MIRAPSAAVMAAFMLAGCESAQPPPIDARAIGLVQAEIKRQVGVYLLAAEDAPVYVKIGEEKVDIRGKKDLFWCGSGKVDYDISSIKAELTTSLELNAGASLTVTAPAPVPVSGTFSFSRGTENSQTLTYNLWPFAMKWQLDEFLAGQPRYSQGDDKRFEEDLKSSQIAQVLLSLRQAQISGATRIDYLTGQPRWPQPCFVNYDPSKPASDAGNSFTIALTITTTAKGEVSVGVAAAKIGANASSTTKTGHSLKVTFVQRGLARVQALKEKVDLVCKGVDPEEPKCAAATDAYDRYRLTGEIGEQFQTVGFKPSPGGGPGTQSVDGRGGGGGGRGGTGVLKNERDR